MGLISNRLWRQGAKFEPTGPFYVCLCCPLARTNNRRRNTCIAVPRSDSLEDLSINSQYSIEMGGPRRCRWEGWYTTRSEVIEQAITRSDINDNAFLYFWLDMFGDRIDTSQMVHRCFPEPEGETDSHWPYCWLRHQKVRSLGGGGVWGKEPPEPREPE